MSSLERKVITVQDGEQVHSFEMSMDASIEEVKDGVSNITKLHKSTFTLKYKEIYPLEGKKLRQLYDDEDFVFVVCDLLFNVMVKEERNHNVMVQNSMTVAEFRSKIEEKMGKKSDYVLSYNMEAMEDNMTIRHYNLEKGSLVNVLFKLHGGEKVTCDL